MRTEPRRAVFALFVFLWLVHGVCPRALALVGDSNKGFGLDGSIRAIGAVVDNYDYPPFFGEENGYDEYGQSVLRLTAMGRPADGLSYEAHLVGSLTYFSRGRAPRAGGFDLSAGKTRYRALYEDFRWDNEDRWASTVWLDRANVKVRLEAADITLGRQAVTFGKAHFWNPLDVYLPFDPRQFDRDYKPGVDAARLDIPLGPFSGITLVGVAGRELDQERDFSGGAKALDASWYGSSVLGRAYTNLKGWDLVLQGGKVYGGFQAGGGLVGEVGGVQVRGEGAFFFANDSPALMPPLEGELMEDYLAVVAGLGYRFENSLVVDLEYLFNGGGEDDDDLNIAYARAGAGSIIHMGRHLLGFMASYEFTPLIVGRIALIQSLSDSSTQAQPVVTLSVTDNAELLLGVSLNFGKRPRATPLGSTEIRSEFGTSPNLYFLEFKLYF